jgi:acrylyl-CoA reductase (NADPH)
VGSHDLPIKVYPFIIRGVVLIGIDSQNCPMPLRRAVWERLAGEWKLDHLDQITTETTLEGLSEKMDMALERKHRGRTIVRMPE